MSNKKRIEQFNKENAPFYLVDHGKEYSLCLLLGGTPTAAAEYGQYAFDHYAEIAGKPIEENGWLTYGDGYDWECVFKKAYENDPAFRKVHSDCESSGFFCISEDLSVLESFGKSFKDLCENHDEFIKLVERAMRESDAEKEEALQGIRTVRELIEVHPNSSFDMVTPMGYVVINAEQAAELLKGKPVSGFLGFGDPPHVIDAEDLLPLPVESLALESIEGSDRYHALIGMPLTVEEKEPTMSM